MTGGLVVGAVRKEGDEEIDGVVEEAAVAVFIRQERPALDLAQPFERIAALVDVIGDRRVLEVRACFKEEQKENAVHVAQAFNREFVRERGITLDLALLLAGALDDLIGGFVSEKFNGSAKRLLEGLGNAVCLLVGILVHVVEKSGGAVSSRHGFGRKEGGADVDHTLFATAEDLLPVKAQHAVTVELRAVNEEPVFGGGENDPARRVLGAEDALFQNAVPVVGEVLLGGRRQIKLEIRELFGLHEHFKRIGVRRLNNVGPDGGRSLEHPDDGFGPFAFTIKRAQKRQWKMVLTGRVEGILRGIRRR